MKGISMAKSKSCSVSSRLGQVGGQAVLEGVMMKAGERTVTTCKKEDGSIVVYDDIFVSVRKKHKFLNIPILRGVVNFVEMMILSMKTLGHSADAMGLDELSEEEKRKKEEKKKKKAEKSKKLASETDSAAKAEDKKPAKEKSSSKTTDIVMILSTILGLFLAVVLFMYLPGLASDGINRLIKLRNPDGLHPAWLAIIEGVAKIIIFILYLSLTSLMKDIKRTFMCHGAEHKSIACFEAGEELTPENARRHTRFHPRCGTSFMFVMIFLGILSSIAVNLIFKEKFALVMGDGLTRVCLSLIKLLILPLIVGLGYEFIMFAGKHPNPVTRILSAPGLLMQRITTKEPTDEMLEIAIISIKCALRDSYPDFKEFYDTRGWEKKSDAEDSALPEGTDKNSDLTIEKEPEIQENEAE